LKVVVVAAAPTPELLPSEASTQDLALSNFAIIVWIVPTRDRLQEEAGFAHIIVAYG
jgi:hypothetical protein